jgi:hypothetical protein
MRFAKISAACDVEWRLCLEIKGSHAAHSVCRMWTASVAAEHIWTQTSAHPLRKARTVVDRQQSQREHLYTYGDEYQRSPQPRHGTIAPIKNSDPLTGWGCLPGPSTLSGVLPRNKPFQRNHVQVVVVCPLKVLHSATQHWLNPLSVLILDSVNLLHDSQKGSSFVGRHAIFDRGHRFIVHSREVKTNNQTKTWLQSIPQDDRITFFPVLHLQPICGPCSGHVPRYLSLCNNLPNSSPPFDASTECRNHWCTSLVLSNSLAQRWMPGVLSAR